ncbi:MAG: CBS domain-containing protein [Candidatus Hydrothermarchaeales archaeon]
MQVKDIMTKEVVYAEVPGSVAEALELIIKKNISGMPVVKRGSKELLGIITRDDFSEHPEETQLALLMTREVVAISPEANVEEAAKLFLKKKFRRMPVVKDGEVLGILTVNDLIGRAIGKMGISTPVGKYLRKSVTAVWEGTPIKVAYELMHLAGFRAFPVLNSEGMLVGIVANTDLLKVAQVTESTQKSELAAAMEGDKWGWDSKNVIYITKKTLELPDLTVEEIMVPNVITATKKTTTSDCAKKMAKARVEQVPVIDAEGNIIGLVRDIDLLKAF